MTAASYVPGLDRVVASVEENQRAEQLHVGFNLEEWKKNPNSTTLEKANLIHAKNMVDQVNMRKAIKNRLLRTGKAKTVRLYGSSKMTLAILNLKLKQLKIGFEI